MSLELAPEIESAVRAYADREGVNASEYIAHLLPYVTPERTPHAGVQALLSRWQAQDGTPTAMPAPNDATLTPSESLFKE